MKNRGGCMIVSLMLVLVCLGMSSVIAGDIPLVKPEELKRMIDEGRADIVVVDNQPKEAYDRGHIKGAINFPWAMQIRYPSSLPPDKTLILYCACEHEEDATEVANQLIERFEYNNIKLLEGGWLKWIKLGYPVEKSK